MKKKSFGLALGSGGVKGLAHVGVIACLVKNGLIPDYIAGTSIGSWVGAHFALYQDVEKLTEFTVGKRKEKLYSLVEPSLSGGVVRGKKVEALLKEWLNNATFEDLKIPFCAAATDLITGGPMVFSTGYIVPALRASMSIPTMFQPVVMDGRVLVDGGISNPVPVSVAKSMGADVVLAVNLDSYEHNNAFTDKDATRIGKVMGRSLDVMRRYLALAATKDANITISPQMPAGEVDIWKSYFMNKLGQELVDSGYAETEKIIPELKKLLGRK